MASIPKRLTSERPLTRFSTVPILAISLSFTACTTPNDAVDGPHRVGMEGTEEVAADVNIEDFHPDDPNVLQCPATGAIEVLKPGDEGYVDWTRPQDEN